MISRPTCYLTPPQHGTFRVQILHALHTSFSLLRSLLRAQMYCSLMTASSLHQLLAKNSALHKALQSVKDPTSLQHSCAGPSAYGPIFAVCGTPVRSILGVPWWAEQPKRWHARQRQSQRCSCRQSCSGQLQVHVEPHAVYWHGQTHVSKHHCCYNNVAKLVTTMRAARMSFKQGGAWPRIRLPVCHQAIGSAGLTV